jgi:hypothetical protein
LIHGTKVNDHAAGPWITAERAAEFAAIGVHRLVLLAGPEPDGTARAIEAGLAAAAGLR